MIHGEAMKGLPSHSLQMNSSPFALLAFDTDPGGARANGASTARAAQRPDLQPVISTGAPSRAERPFPCPSMNNVDFPAL
ncbi:hypothetical protein GCM10010297_45030 [Streptomyces malachitofuscus]|nr:hypothetical protein GCM10010297_45030 [Streptomyces malachitofuscus]